MEIQNKKLFLNFSVKIKVYLCPAQLLKIKSIIPIKFIFV